MNICVTGASSGIGRELVKQLIKDGHIVWGIARRENLLEELKKELGSDSQFFYSVCDVSVQDDVLSVVHIMEQDGFILDAVIMGAGVFLNDISSGFDYKLFKKVIDTNLYGSLNFVDVFLPKFLKQGYGQFIAISSITALKPSLRGVGYPASKSALGIAFRCLDLAYRKKNVIFSTIYLGPVATDMWNAKKSFAVADKKQIASTVKHVLKTKKSVYYVPFWSTLISRISFLPDRWYITLTELFR
ncbi:MAG: hypothetical protein A2735_00565 [Candidatus Yanofskybacteria bacterium RIFCSPHIGHO2_01_FULL_41_21]|uniref:Short-chain dehydrogenase n=1 Tax=Candidatus Yanofskybacteria bacterium RIFCSPHIGHO2_01_FULL_41_21 TaxID=1802660 RepID=A0A1F8EBE7_9BACT|nr:MAG: hypothetical protein A2735_00565 [Candidatus Yanofskybacteria bacterium RIFCSPHIGHO2_01_FULL_41_21]